MVKFQNIRNYTISGHCLLNSHEGGFSITIKKNYKVYLHTNLSNGMKYVGITRLPEQTRWGNGIGYKDNKKFYKDIKKYSWDGFSHEIIQESLTYREARELETKLIKKYDTVKNGYNNVYGNMSNNTNFNYFDFALLDNQKYKIKNSNYLLFTKIPNIFIQKNLSVEYGLHRIFLVVFIMIDRNRTHENKSHVTIGQILDMCGYKHSKNKPKVFFEIVKSILFLKENNYIDTSFDIYGINYSDSIEIDIITKNFDITTSFTILYYRDFDKIMKIKSKPTKESILLCYLYINSYIGRRKRNEDGSEKECPEKHPEAFFKSIESMSKELSMSKDTINQCIKYLISDNVEVPALLVKKEVGSVSVYDKPPKNVPNIYVLNKESYENEIKWALSKMLEMYNVESFDEIKNGNKVN